MSFGFYNVTDSWEMSEGKDVRTIKSARLFDVSVVTNPAYQETSVGVRCEPALRSLQERKEKELVDTTDFEAVGELVDLRLRLRIAEKS